MTGLRLQLVLSKAGVASRRAAEALITAGRVTVNGKKVTELGTRVDPVADVIAVDGKAVSREAPAYYLLNKPKGYVTTAADPEGRQTVFELIKNRRERLFAVGRLDYNTEGALLLTNDGELAFALMHPSRGVLKIYHAKLRGKIKSEQLTRLRRGVVLPPARPLDATGRPLQSPYAPGPGQRGKKPAPLREAEQSAPCEVTVLKETSQHTWLEFELHEGKNRQIHRMAEAIGSSLLKLMRVQYASLDVDDLPVGQSRPLTAREVAELRRGVGLSARAPEPPPAPHKKPPNLKEPPQGRPPLPPPRARASVPQKSAAAPPPKANAFRSRSPSPIGNRGHSAADPRHR